MDIIVNYGDIAVEQILKQETVLLLYNMFFTRGNNALREKPSTINIRGGGGGGALGAGNLGGALLPGGRVGMA